MITCSSFFLCYAQEKGLEGIFIEKYYISNKNDIGDSNLNGNLSVNSVTYRIFVDLLPMYRFQVAFGNKNHPLFFRTSTYFYNNLNGGAAIASMIPMRTLKRNTVMLDSWLSVGSAAELHMGIPKAEDDTLGSIQHESNYFSNTSNQIEISPKEKDGLEYSLKIPLHTTFGIDSSLQVFSFRKGNEFYTENGAWACLGKGSIGVDSLGSNKVLIAQLTTDGELDIQLNIQILAPDGSIQRYVASNPLEGEFTVPSLIYTSRKKKNNFKTKS